MNSIEYERLVAAFLGDLKVVQDIKLFHLREFIGKRSHRKIKIDVSFEFDIHGFNLLTLIECKHYKRKVDVSDVGEFRTTIDDIGAHKGIIVTTVGFQEGAIKSAKSYGIGLARLSDRPQPGDILIIAAGPMKAPPKHRIEGEVLSGAFHMTAMSADYWHWFPNARGFIHHFYVHECLTLGNPGKQRTK